VLYVTRDGTPSKHGLSSSEVEWVYGYGAWWSSEFETVNTALDATVHEDDPRQLVQPFGALRRCKPSYERVAGHAPDALGPVEDESMRACSWAGRAADLVGLDRYVPNAKRRTALTETSAR